MELGDGVLAVDLAVKNCDSCKGTWIPSENYSAWQMRQPRQAATPDKMPNQLSVNFVQSPFDMKAALCPDCSRYLSRARVNLDPAFYVERCQNCGGVWCDHGEWDILTQLGLSTTIEQLFTSDWQNRVREKQQADQEKIATIEKLGPEIAEKIFALAEQLEKHPNGDFGVAYLMRRVSESVGKNTKF